MTLAPTDVINIEFSSGQLRISQPGLNFCVTLSALHKSEHLEGSSGLRECVALFGQEGKEEDDLFHALG